MGVTYYRVKAKIDTVLALETTKEDLSGQARWEQQPGGSVPVTNDETIFIAVGRDDSWVSINGSVSYVSALGTEFTFSFEDRWQASNTCSSSMSNVSDPVTLPTPSYPDGASDYKWTVTFIIASKDDFHDAGVFTSHILEAARCADFKDDVVRRWIGDRRGVRLADVLEHHEIPIEGKLWCATHRLFLTPSSKAILARDLAKMALEEAGLSGAHTALFDEITQTSADLQAGRVDRDKFDALARQARRAAADEPDSRRSKALSVFASLATRDLHEAWTYCVERYLDHPGAEDRAGRTELVLKLVERRL